MRSCSITGVDAASDSGKACSTMRTTCGRSGRGHYMWMGRFATVAGILASIACAYFASNYSNAMDVVQLVFGFVNAPLFATFVLGMFWARTTGTAQSPEAV